MKIEYDESKRQKILDGRGLDFEDAKIVFQGRVFTIEDDRFDYPETRFQTYGMLNDRLVMLAWTKSSDAIRIISMRKCNEREQKKFKARLG